MNCVHKVNSFPTCNDITVHFFQCLSTLLITSFCTGYTCTFTPMQIWPILSNTVEQQSYSEIARLQARLQQYANWELPDVQTGLRKSRGIRVQVANIQWIIKWGNSRKTSTSPSLTTLKPLTVWTTTNHGKFLKSWNYQITSWEICMQVKKQQLEPDME